MTSKVARSGRVVGDGRVAPGPSASRVTFDLPRLAAGAAMSRSPSLESRRRMDALPPRRGQRGLDRVVDALATCLRAADQVAAAVMRREPAVCGSTCPTGARAAAEVRFPLFGNGQRVPASDRGVAVHRWADVRPPF